MLADDPPKDISILDAVMEGRAMRKDEDDYEDVPTAAAREVEEELSDAELLGESTLAKMEAAAEEEVVAEVVEETEEEESDSDEETSEE